MSASDGLTQVSMTLPSPSLAEVLKALLAEKAIDGEPASEVIWQECDSAIQGAEFTNSALKKNAALVLATICIEETGDLTSIPVEKRRQKISKAMSLYTLTVKMAGAVQPPIGIASLANDAVLYREMRKCVDDFETAAAPRPVRGLKGEVLDQRVRAWVELRERSDEYVCERAKTTFQARMNLAMAADLAKRIPPIRLRTYSAEGLEELAKNFVEWNPLFEFLRNRNGASRRPLDPVLAKRIDDLIEKLVRTVISKTRSRESSEDSVQDALKRAIETADDPCLGYTFEESLLTWLAIQATKAVERPNRKTKALVNIDLEAKQHPSRNDSLVPAVNWLCRLWIVRLLSQTDEDAGQVKEIWVARVLFEDGLTDAQLAQLLFLETGTLMQPESIAGKRRKMRQRLRVLEYLLDEVPGGKADDPGDISVLIMIATEMGLDEKDKPTLRTAAALSRAAKADEDRSLIWAGFARRIVDLNKAADQAESLLRAAWSFLSQSAAFSSSPSTARQLPQLDHRIQLARNWLMAKPQGLSELRKWAKKEGFSPLISAMWYLRVLCGKNAADTLAMLNVSASEQVVVSNALEQLF